MSSDLAGFGVGTGHKNYPNVLNIELRNLMDAPLVIGRPNFKFAKGVHAGRYAHGNTATGDYEIKFRPMGTDGLPIPGYSYTHAMLRYREQAYSYLPLTDDWDEQATVQSVSATELIVGDDDKHLNFRISCLKTQRDGQAFITLSTVVQIHNRPGHVYMFIVKPFHRFIAPCMVRRAMIQGRL